jgi:hypothetical protein
VCGNRRRHVGLSLKEGRSPALANESLTLSLSSFQIAIPNQLKLQCISWNQEQVKGGQSTVINS